MNRRQHRHVIAQMMHAGRGKAAGTQLTPTAPAIVLPVLLERSVDQPLRQFCAGESATVARARVSPRPTPE